MRRPTPPFTMFSSFLPRRAHNVLTASHSRGMSLSSAETDIPEG